MLSAHSNEKVDLLNIVSTTYARELDTPSAEPLSKFLRRFLTTELLPFEAKQVEQDVINYEPFRVAETEHADSHL